MLNALNIINGEIVRIKRIYDDVVSIELVCKEKVYNCHGKKSYQVRIILKSKLSDFKVKGK